MPADGSREWNYHPDLPLADNSIFKWPPRPRFLARWVLRNWLTLSERMMLVLLSFGLWYLVYPSIEESRNFAFGWIARVYVTNLGVMTLAAGGLHWYFFMRKAQGLKLKFDRRDLTKNNRAFTFSDQTRDTMFWSLASGVFFWTLFQSITLWLMANGYAPMITFAENPIWFLLALILVPIWSAFHFYWAHRLLHVPFLYKPVHSLHHRSINIGPWSGLAMHPVEAFIYFTTICIHWVVPTHPVHLIFHLIYQGPGAAMTHTGYESLLVKDRERLALGTFYHTLHHRYFECNYGNQEMPWDRWFGTFHDGSEQATAQTRARKKKMYS